MLPYDERQSFRTKSPASKTGGKRSAPILRDETLDDLHRALYGTLHPAGVVRSESYEEDEDLVAGESPESGEGWLGDNALTAAVAVVGAFALFAWLKKSKTSPLVFSPPISSDAPLPGFTPSTPTPQSTP